MRRGYTAVSKPSFRFESTRLNNNFDVTPLDAPLGAEVRGLDLTLSLGGDALDALSAAWLEYSVLVFRGQALEDDQLIEFSRHFGELDPPGPNPYGRPINPDNPLINIISNIEKDGQPIGNLGYGEAVWHADMTYVETPPRGAVLHAHELPPAGGNTYFANMHLAYETLDESLKARFEPLMAIHDASRNSAGMLRKGYAEITDVRDTPGARHPLVHTHPRSGKKCLFLGRRPNSYIVGLEVDESEALLDTLWAHATQAHHAMTHEWRLGDVLMWDNLAVLHKRDAFDPNARRRLHRTQLKGVSAIT